MYYKCVWYDWFDDMYLNISKSCNNCLIIYNLICKLNAKKMQITLSDISFAYLHLANAIIHRRRMSRIWIQFFSYIRKNPSRMFVGFGGFYNSFLKLLYIYILYNY